MSLAPHGNVVSRPENTLSAFRILPTIPPTFPHFLIPHFTFRNTHFTNDRSAPETTYLPINSLPSRKINNYPSIIRKTRQSHKTANPNYNISFKSHD